MLPPRRDSYHDLNDPELEEQFFNFASENPDDEEIYTESLMEELKKVQDMYNVTLQEKQNEEAQRIKLNQMKLKLEHQLQQFSEVQILIIDSFLYQLAKAKGHSQRMSGKMIDIQNPPLPVRHRLCPLWQTFVMFT